MHNDKFLIAHIHQGEVNKVCADTDNADILQDKDENIGEVYWADAGQDTGVEQCRDCPASSTEPWIEKKSTCL